MFFLLHIISIFTIFCKRLFRIGWITKNDVIEHIKEFNWSCYVYVTPYQIKSRKLWYIEEYNKFIDLLAKNNVNMKNVYYFENKEGDFDIEIHFELLRIFDSSLI